LKDKNVASVKTTMDELNKELQAFSSELYKNAQAQQQAQQGAQQEAPKEEKKEKKKKDDNVVDADFKMEDDKDKK